MLIICLLAVPASFVLPLLYGAGFSDVAVQLLILLPGVYLIGIESVLVQHFNATGLPVAIPLFWTGTLVTNIALTFALVPLYGARGAAVASTATYAMIFAMVALYFSARTGRSFSEALLPRRGEVRELLTAGRHGVSLRRA
jgi:O-antigen/teichoic acid export membrane protein